MTRAIGNPNYQGPFGNTLLHSAVVSGDIDEVKRLLAAGADPTIANRDGRTPLHAAAMFGHVKLYELLARHGQEPSDPVALPSFQVQRRPEQGANEPHFVARRRSK